MKIMNTIDSIVDMFNSYNVPIVKSITDENNNVLEFENQKVVGLISNAKAEDDFIYATCHVYNENIKGEFVDYEVTGEWIDKENKEFYINEIESVEIK